MLIHKQQICYIIRGSLVVCSFKDFLLDFWRTLQPVENGCIIRGSQDFELPDVVRDVSPNPRPFVWSDLTKRKIAFAYINRSGEKHIWFPQRLMVIPENEHDIGTSYRIKL